MLKENTEFLHFPPKRLSTTAVSRACEKQRSETWLKSLADAQFLACRDRVVSKQNAEYPVN